MASRGEIERPEVLVDVGRSSASKLLGFKP